MLFRLPQIKRKIPTSVSRDFLFKGYVYKSKYEVLLFLFCILFTCVAGILHCATRASATAGAGVFAFSLVVYKVDNNECEDNKQNSAYKDSAPVLHEPLYHKRILLYLIFLVSLVDSLWGRKSIQSIKTRITDATTVPAIFPLPVNQEPN